ncbi:DUF6111 family protein [Zavarzinia compransoris]|uniref:DUF6111 family protein n=1 Tax=Zavarzinia marina TaxID=2911065 RepID=UPI001F16D3C9|nr:DUF6111 family protein [Zavarzinia marina]MCF4165017.1 DUF6111 family protein [Zavarzinia marina]
MGRIILLYVLAMVLPYVAFKLWIRFERWRLRQPPEKRPVPWIPIVAVGTFLVILVTLGEAFLGGDPAGGRYVPARLEDGRLIPGHIEAE